jgi:hypothetical protein
VFAKCSPSVCHSSRKFEGKIVGELSEFAQVRGKRSFADYTAKITVTISFHSLPLLVHYPRSYAQLYSKISWDLSWKLIASKNLFVADQRLWLLFGHRELRDARSRYNNTEAIRPGVVQRFTNSANRRLHNQAIVSILVKTCSLFLPVSRETVKNWEKKVVWVFLVKF